MRRVPECALQLARQFEGFFNKVYRCPAGYWTIGVGHRCAADHPEIDDAKGDEYLSEDMTIALRAAIVYSPNLLNAADEILGAIVDFIFNLGSLRYKSSTLRRRVNEEDWDGAAEQLPRWVYAGDKKLRGLVLRRAAEAALLLEGANDD